jgi:hypothetical protein
MGRVSRSEQILAMIVKTENSNLPMVRFFGQAPCFALGGLLRADRPDGGAGIGGGSFDGIIGRRSTAKALILLIAIPSIFASCVTDLRPISANSSAPHTLVVERGYTRHRIATTFFPAGRYTAQYEDSQGTYYVAPTKIISTAFGLLDGGFYVPFGHPVEISAYLVNDDYENDSHTPSKLVDGVPGLSYRFER